MSNLIPRDILDDLCSRFILNVPDEGKKDNNRILFNVELAHWFYLDFYCVENKKYPTVGMRDFATQIFNHVPSLKESAANIDDILARWKEYKMSVPTYGAILLDEFNESVLLVQGCWANANWGFPKGKVNEKENPHDCAVREVLEETGFDISKLIKEDDYIEHQLNDQLNRLYIISGVSKKTDFKPQTRNEIKSLEWFKVADLPSHKKDPTPKNNLGMTTNSFFMVMPFMKPIRKWIANKSGRISRTRSKTIGDTASITKEDNVPESRSKKQQQQQYFKQMCQLSLTEYLTDKDDKTQNQSGGASQSQSTRQNQNDQTVSSAPTRSRREKEKRSNRPTYSPPPRMQKLKQRLQQQNNKLSPVQIISRDESMSTKSPSSIKKCLAPQFETDDSDICINLCDAWKNFKFNRKEIFACLVNR